MKHREKVSSYKITEGNKSYESTCKRLCVLDCENVSGVKSKDLTLHQHINKTFAIPKGHAMHKAAQREEG